MNITCHNMNLIRNTSEHIVKSDSAISFEVRAPMIGTERTGDRYLECDSQLRFLFQTDWRF